MGFLTASVRQGRLGVGWRTLSDLSVEPAATASLSIAEVDAAISRLAAAGGAGSAAARTEELARLWARATAEEQRQLTGILLGEVRIGALEGVLTDAGGNRVKGVVGGVSTVYVAGVYEQTGAATIRYYGEAGAMRRAGFVTSNGVFYLLSDQVNSTSVITSRAGNQPVRNYYYPFGGNRGGAATPERMSL